MKLLSFLLLPLLLADLSAQIVINEIHYDPADSTRQEEFIELHNPTASPVNVSGWRIEDGVDFVIPGGTTIPAGGYLVVAQNPVHFQTRYAFSPLGPWTGALANRGERIQLKNTSAVVVDEVEYGVGFPWPTAARGAGPSMELVHPSLDNNLSGSWRSAVTVPDVPIFSQGSGGWSYRPGSSEASSPIDAWRAPGFALDGTWIQNATTPIGYGEPDIAPSGTISGMQNSYWTLFMRKTFTMTAGNIPGSLVLRVRADDGCIVWLNGTELSQRIRVSVGSPAIIGTNGATALTTTNAPEPVTFVEIPIPNAGSILQAGTNVLAIQQFNTSLGSSDLLMNAELVIPGSSNGGSPGVVNSAFTAAAPPQIRQVNHTPEQPTAGVPVVVTAKITDPDGVASATLSYQLVNPGSYIRKTDAAYATTWTNVAMNDAGTDGDVLAGDGIFSATMPAALQTHRRLVRYRISATDGATAITVPYADDEQPNFAYLCYTSIPSWTGRNQPPSGTAITFPTTLMATLPAYHLITNETDVINSQYNSGFDTVRMWGTLVYDGRVYDHVEYHNKGSASTYQSGKNKWRFHFNRARGFQARDSWGRNYNQTWDTFTMHACASPWNPCFRGWAGLDEVVSARIYELAGVPAPKMHHLQFRVVRRAAEAATPGVTVSDPFGPAGTLDGQYSSDMWGLYLVVEDPDGSFLDERGLDDGSVYHIAGNAGDKTKQGPTHPTDTSDWDAFRNASQVNTADTPANETWWRTNMDIAGYTSFHACNRITGNVDLREGWNHYFYRRGTDNRWVPIPWDLDMMYFPETHWSGTIDQKNALLMTGIALDFRNRSRELLDLICEDGTATGGQIGQLVDEYKRIIRPAGQPVGWDVLDQYMWNYHPRTTGGHTGAFYLPNPTNDGRIGGTWTRTYSSSDFNGICNFLIGYATDTDPNTFAIGDGDQRGYGYNYVELEATDAAIPNRPTITFSGTAGFPANDLRFTTSAFSDPQGAGTFAAMQWRLGEISAPGVGAYVAGDPFKYEATDIFRSAEITTFAASFRFPVTACEPGHTYRARVRTKDNTGRWSRWSPAVQFTASTPDVSVYTGSLVISEVNYNPAPVTPAEFAAGFSSDDFEWIEVKNVSALPVDMTGMRFTKGVDFDFPAGWTIPPGGFALVVRNLAAFQMRNGTGFNSVIAGVTPDNLKNEGEQLKLSYGAGTAVIDFTYTNVAPWPDDADNTGRTLSLRNPGTLPDPTAGANWKASYAVGGSPGADDVFNFASWSSAYPGLTDPLGDDDHDGLQELLEMGLNGDPEQPSPAAFPIRGTGDFTIEGVPGEYLTITYTRRTDASDLQFSVEFAEGPSGIWTSDGVLIGSSPAGENTVTETWRAPFSRAQKPEQFGRVKVTLP